MKVPQCSCGHPIDAHDVKTGECIFPPRCSCTRFFDVAGGHVDEAGRYVPPRA